LDDDLTKMTSYKTSLEGSIMKVWQVQDAKARFSELLDDCLSEGPQLVTKRGVDAAVLVPVHEWKRLQDNARPTLKALLLSDDARSDFNLPPRGRRSRRVPQAIS
jgi:antitoxin Phd